MSESETEETPAIKQLRDQLKTLEKENAGIKAQLAEGMEARKMLAFAEAGLNLKKPINRLAAKSYDGDLDSEAIASFLKENELVEEPKPAPDPDAAAFNRMYDAPRQQPPPARDAEYQSAMDGARSAEDVLRVAEQFGRVSHFE